MRGTRSVALDSSSFARSLIHRVIAASAGPPVGGLYLNPPSSGGLCEGVMTMPWAAPDGRPRLGVRIACEIAEGGAPVGSIDHGLGAVCGEPFHGCPEGRLRERVRILADEERTGDVLADSVLADGLSDRQDVRLVERAAERRASVTAGAEADAL